jgi:hypothetical protein
MNYFNEGCILLLNDFSDFCKQCNEDFDVGHAKSLIESFLQSRQTMQNEEVETSGSVTVIPENRTKSSKTKPTIRKATAAEGTASKGGSKNTEISVDEFNKLSISEIKNTAWYNKILVSTLKDLCTKLGLSVTKQTKTQIIDNLIQYKTSQNQNDDETLLEAEKTEVLEPSTQKPKRRVIASAIVKPVVKITKRHGLNLVFCDDNDDDIILVLSEDQQLCGFIPKEEYSEDDTPRVLKVTKDVIRVAKNMGIAYEVPETIE